MYKKVIFIFLLLVGVAGFYSYRTSLRPLVLLQVGSFVCSTSCFAQALTDKLQDVDFLTARQNSVLHIFKQQVVQDFIVKSVVTDWAQQNNLFVKEDEIAQRIDAVRQQYPSDLQLKEALAQRGLNFHKWRNKIKYSVLEKKVFAHIHKNLKPQYKDKDLKLYYEQHRNQFKLKPQVQLSQIILPSHGQAQHLRQKLKQGSSFEKVAQQVRAQQKKSLRREAQPAGRVKNVGWVEPGGFEVFDKAFSRPVGWVSDVQQSEHGFHIVKVEGHRRARQLSFEAVKPRIEALYQARAQEKNYKTWLEARLKSLKVYKNEPLIEALQVETSQSY